MNLHATFYTKTTTNKSTENTKQKYATHHTYRHHVMLNIALYVWSFIV